MDNCLNSEITRSPTNINSTNIEMQLQQMQQQMRLQMEKQMKQQMIQQQQFLQQQTDAAKMPDLSTTIPNTTVAAGAATTSSTVPVITNLDATSQQIVNNNYIEKEVPTTIIKEVPTISAATAAEINAVKEEKEKLEKLNSELVLRENELDTKLTEVEKHSDELSEKEKKLKSGKSSLRFTKNKVLI